MMLEGVLGVLAPLTFVIVSGSGWDAALVEDQVKEASAVYSECGVSLAPIQTIVVPAPSAPLKKHSQSSEHGLPIESFVKSLGIETEGVTVYFVGSFSNPREITAFSRADFPGTNPPFDPALFNSVWLPFSITSKSAQERTKNYSVFAHELAHIYLMDGFHNGKGQPTGIGSDKIPGEPDLMTTWRGRTNLISHLCEKILESPLIRRQGL